MNSPLSSSICLLSSRLILTHLHFAPQEALQRELVLKQKMVILQDLLSTLIQASDSTWKVRETFVWTELSGFYMCPILFIFPYHCSKRRSFLTTEEAQGRVKHPTCHSRYMGELGWIQGHQLRTMLPLTQGRPRIKKGKNFLFLICWKKNNVSITVPVTDCGKYQLFLYGIHININFQPPCT